HAPGVIKRHLGEQIARGPGAVVLEFEVLASRPVVHDCVFTLAHKFAPSWPGLSRPSTSFLIGMTKEDVDARDKRGHDGESGSVERNMRYLENFLYLIRCGITVSVPSRCILSFS